MIYDCFLFYDELELLELRLNHLNSIVDRFVIVESNKTFSLKDKPLFFSENRERFSKFREKIILVVVDDFLSSNAWENETLQRNRILQGLENCSDDDLIMISDCDEIPRVESIRRFVDGYSLVGLQQTTYYYRFNGQTNIAWCGSKLLRYRALRERITPQQVRDKYCGTPDALMIFGGGWHFSFLGSSEKIALKIQAFSHQELNKPEYVEKEKIERRMKEAKDLFDRSENIIEYIPLNSSFPPYLLENLSRFRHLIH